MELVFILAAYIAGFVADRVRLPPLVGYLAAGFVLHAFGYETTAAIDAVAEFGLLLLLFGIGLKLKLRTLSRPEVWAGASMHMIAATLVFGLVFWTLGLVGLPLVSGLEVGEAALVGFAFSFSSTVYAIKALEQRNEASSLAGRIAVGILIIQDLFAVAFLATVGGDVPSLLAIPVVVAIVAARPLYGWMLDRSGHGELLILLGFFLAVGVGAGASELAGLKADVGALLVGLTLANHRRAPELADRLLSFKDILLIGFFLSIGLGGTPGIGAVLVAVVALVLLPGKVVGFLALIPRFGLRARTAWHAAVTLATFSEFGLIVVAAGTREGLIDPQWGAAVAVAVAVSFGLSSPLNAARYQLFARFASRLDRLERSEVRPEDSIIDPGPARVVVFGMGRVGAGAYDELIRREGQVVVGIDRSDEIVEAHLAAGRRAVRGDALDNEFWERIRLGADVELAVIAMNDHRANLEAVKRIRQFLPHARLAAAANYDDEVRELVDAGVDVARNLLSEAGQGLADDACDLLLT